MNIINKRLCAYVSQNMNVFVIMVGVIFTTLSLRSYSFIFQGII